jgi:hypothetical protein
MFESWDNRHPYPVLILEIIEESALGVLVRFLYSDGSTGLWRLHLPYYGAKHYEL